MTPLRKARKKKGLTLGGLACLLRSSGIRTDAGNLSRIERATQKPSAELAEAICKIFEGDINEIHIFYPERFAEQEAA